MTSQIPTANDFWTVQKFPGRPEIPATVTMKQATIDLLPKRAQAILGTASNIRAKIQSHDQIIDAVPVDVPKLTRQLEELETEFTSLCNEGLSLKAIFDAEPTI